MQTALLPGPCTVRGEDPILWVAIWCKAIPASAVYESSGTQERGSARPDLKQNQFGFTAGGPIRRDRIYYFGSYQGTRQINGLAAGQARISCTADVVVPPLTDDRSAQALGALFAGKNGAFGGVTVKADGSNINPVALKILNFKLPGGSHLIPSPQVVNTSLPLASQGLSITSTPCHFDEDQVLTNIDENLPQNSSLAMPVALPPTASKPA